MGSGAPASAPAVEPGWLTERRERATARVAELELPSFKGRPGWEFTDLSGLDLEAFAVAAQGNGGAALDETKRLFEPIEGAARIDQVDATGSWEVGELPDGVVIAPLRAAVEHVHDLVEPHLGSLVSADDLFVARNDAAWTGGLFVYVPRGVRLEAPVMATAVHAAAGTAMHWRTLVVLEEGAEAEVFEQHLSATDDAEGLFNGVTELIVGPGATLRYVSGQDLSERTWVFGAERGDVQRDGNLDWVTLGFGSAHGRVSMDTRLAGEGAHARVTGAYAAHARQHLDFDTNQEHAAAHTTSDLAFRGILDGRATAVWKGMIRVDPGAQQTDAFQESRNLLLSKRAHADAIPGLEIQANDVRCTHAAAIAQIDPEQLFYLRSHGLPEAGARRLVIEGFMAALVERLAEGPVRERVAGALERRLETILG